jgi:hypothetical protein
VLGYIRIRESLTLGQVAIFSVLVPKREFFLTTKSVTGTGREERGGGEWGLTAGEPTPAPPLMPQPGMRN